MSETKKNSVEEYDLKKSDHVGQLYPVLKDKHGNVIDGFHRLEADPNWRTETRENIDSEEKLLVARAMANWHRRQVSREEKTKWINGLAEIYKKQGLVVGDIGFENQIVNKIAEVTGLYRTTVTEHLREQFKQKPHAATTEAVSKPRISASQRIESALGTDYVERHREEVLEKERHKIEEETAEKLLTDKKFVSRMAKQVLPAHKWVKCDGCDLLTKGEPDEEGKIFCSMCRNKHAEERGFAEEPPTDQSKPPLVLPEGVVDDWTPNGKKREDSKPDLDLITKTNYVLYAKELRRKVEDGAFVCPDCGNTRLVWSCGHSVYTDDVLNQLRKGIHPS